VAEAVGALRSHPIEVKALQDYHVELNEKRVD
jgi:hypothetical protein